MKGILPDRIAIVHDWLITHTGAEKVLEQMLNVFPQADLYSIVDLYTPEMRALIQNKHAVTSFIQHLPFARKHFRKYLFLMPLAIEQFDLSPYDLVISSNFAVAKGILTNPDQLHLCMCYSPIRYAWDLQNQYLKEAGLERGLLSGLVRLMLHYIRLWDVRTSNGVDAFIAISNFISRRIWKIYHRDSTVIYPPVNVDYYDLKSNKEDFFLTVSRFVPYKKINMIVDAFGLMPQKRLIVIGEGADFEKIKARASSNVQLLGYQPNEAVRDYLQRAQAFIFAAEEDFGIAPLEAQACGTPVIAFGKGASLETIQGLDSPMPTGLFFYEQSAVAIAAAVHQFEEVKDRIKPQACRENALRFTPEKFRNHFSAFIEDKWKDYCERMGGQAESG
ncbi:MAG: glycosyltransferase family 4 protein [Chloroflexota bacterium]